MGTDYFSLKFIHIAELKGLDLGTGSFSLRQIRDATNNFDAANKIGEGGFGPVFKVLLYVGFHYFISSFIILYFGLKFCLLELQGVLADGTIIAVKQLSSKSKQGNREFVNEIGMISALQHPHLVKLYGCCIEGNQLLLIYEYLENNSLARALFGKNISLLLLTIFNFFKYIGDDINRCNKHLFEFVIL